MFLPKAFILLNLQIVLICTVQGIRSPLAKVCHDSSDDVCVGVFVTSRWVLVSGMCKHVRYKNAKVIMVNGSLQRDCITGEANRISRIYELNDARNVYLLKIHTTFKSGNISTLTANVKQGYCATYCLQGSHNVCGEKIDPISTRIVPCKHAEACLMTDNNTTSNNLDGSPLFCSGNMIGYVRLLSTKNLLTLVHLSTFLGEINEIIETDGKIIAPTQNIKDEIKKGEDQSPNRRMNMLLSRKRRMLPETENDFIGNEGGYDEAAVYRGNQGNKKSKKSMRKVSDYGEYENYDDDEEDYNELQTRQRKQSKKNASKRGREKYEGNDDTYDDDDDTYIQKRRARRGQGKKKSKTNSAKRSKNRDYDDDDDDEYIKTLKRKLSNSKSNKNKSSRSSSRDDEYDNDDEEYSRKKKHKKSSKSNKKRSHAKDNEYDDDDEDQDKRKRRNSKHKSTKKSNKKRSSKKNKLKYRNLDDDDDSIDVEYI